MISKRTALAALAAIAASAPAHAAVTISTAATQNMNCLSGVCAPTAKDAVLNASDLETMLASGNVSVSTTGSGVQATNINVRTAVSWSASSALTLDAHRSIMIDEPVSVQGVGGLTLITGGTNGTLSFGTTGNVTFASLSSSLSINRKAYTLVGDITTLAADVAAKPSGFYALASNFDASADGTYSRSPVTKHLKGIFDGLGNVISNLTIVYMFKNGQVGLFEAVDAGGTIENLNLSNANVTGGPANTEAGGIAGASSGLLFGDSVSGSVMNGQGHTGGHIGGLVGYSSGTIVNSRTAGSVTCLGGCVVGGLAGLVSGTIANSFSTSTVTTNSEGDAGGLVGGSAASISDSYATGTVSGGRAGGGLEGSGGGPIDNCYASGTVSGVEAGGLVGENGYLISNSYSSGAVSGTIVGGLIGQDNASTGSLSDTYWDTTTSGITNPSQGAGNIANDPGITGLTNKELQSGLPKGFDPKVWAEKATINGGLPYLLANPPPK